MKVSAVSAKIIGLAMTLAVTSAVAQITLSILPQPIDFEMPLNGPISSSVARINVGTVGGGGAVSVKFQYTGVTPASTASPSTPNFVVVTPSSGTISEFAVPIYVGLNASVVRNLAPGRYDLSLNFSTVDQTPPAAATVSVSLGISFTSSPTITSVVNAASFQPALSPGALVSVFGGNFGPAIGSTQTDDTGRYPTAIPDGVYNLNNVSFGNTTVTFGGLAAPITYLSGNQINAMVPYGVAGLKTANVVVTCYNVSSAPFTVPIADTSPGIFTATQNGTGQGAILNVNPNNPNAPGAVTYNGPSNPAPPGSPIVMYATGVGAWNPPIPDGEIALVIANPMCSLPGVLDCTQLVNQPLSLTIGGKTATVFYAGTALYEPWSLLQINAYVPTDAPSGQQPVVLKVGQYDNSQQNVTMAVR